MFRVISPPLSFSFFLRIPLFPVLPHSSFLRCHSLKLRSSPLRRLSIQVLLRLLPDRSLTAASASGPLRTPLPPLGAPPTPLAPPQHTPNPIPQSTVTPDVRQCPDSAVSFSEPCAFASAQPALSRAEKSSTFR
jgi:hypothetical protein